ncbi:MAG: hypothetical protein KF891_07480 [Rhizobacter sp.]|nr:hypothetical protein [Rhizobacter sp.]
MQLEGELATRVASVRAAIASEATRWAWQRANAPAQPMNDAIYAWLAQLDSSTGTQWQARVDDVTSFGPEIVTIRRVAQGTYRYFLNNYSGTHSPGMTGSPVRVEVTYNGNTSVFTPGAGEGTLNNWHAFDIVVDNQCAVTLTPANTWSATEPANPNMNGGAVTYCN